MLHYESSGKKKFTLAVSFFLFLFYPYLSYSHTPEGEAIFILKGSTKLISGKPAEGVEMELKRDGLTITKIMSGKNGKYYLQMDVSITDKNMEYFLYISQAGTIPKTLSINTYIPEEEFNMNTYTRYEFDLQVVMIETSVKDIVLERPSGKILWSATEHAFAFDQVYAKIIQKDEQKLKEDPDKYLKELAEKKKKEEAAKLKSIEDAKLKMDAEAKRLADQKLKEEAEKILQQNLEAMKMEMKRKHRQDSLDSLAVIAQKANVEIQKFVAPVSPEDVDQNAFDGTGAYSINIAKKSLNESKVKMNKEKAKNLSAKYETNNTLTSLLNVVDEYDKKLKKQ